jgi:hypothetical protein
MNAHSPTHRALLAGAALLALSACGPRSGAPSTADTPDSGAGTTLRPRLPTGVYLDPAFGTSGVTQLSGPGGQDAGCEVMTLSGGRPVLAGWTTVSGDDDDFLVARLRMALVFRDGFEHGLTPW